MKYKLCLWLLFVFLAGCASTYNFSAEGMKYRSSLNEGEAFRTVQANIIGSREQAGLCSAHTNIQFTQAEPLAVSAPNIVFSSFIKDMTGVSSNVAARTQTISYVERKATFKINLKQLNKIRVLNEPNSFGCVGSVDGSLRGYIVMIDMKGVADSGKGEPNAVMINVSKDNLDHLIAALSFLSPGAKILEGAGL